MQCATKRANKNIYIYTSYPLPSLCNVCQCVYVCVCVWLCHVSGYATLFATPTSLIILTKLVYLCCSCLAPDDARRVRPPPTPAGCVCVWESANFSITEQQALSPAQHNRGNQGKPVYIFDLSARWASAMQTSARRQQPHTHIEEQASIHSHILAHSGTSTVCHAQCAENAAPLVLISRGTNEAENGNGSEWRCASFIYSWNRSTAHYNPCELRISLIKHTSRLHVMCARRGISSAQFDQCY